MGSKTSKTVGARKLQKNGGSQLVIIMAKCLEVGLILSNIFQHNVKKLMVPMIFVALMKFLL
jgi:hypothetical protein